MYIFRTLYCEKKEKRKIALVVVDACLPNLCMLLHDINESVRVRVIHCFVYATNDFFCAEFDGESEAGVRIRVVG